MISFSLFLIAPSEFGSFFPGLAVLYVFVVICSRVRDLFPVAFPFVASRTRREF